jgi:hypothetical protein
MGVDVKVPPDLVPTVAIAAPTRASMVRTATPMKKGMLLRCLLLLKLSLGQKLCPAVEEGHQG